MGLSQRQLSSLLGFKDHSMLAKIESGLRLPRSYGSYVPRLARWLDISEDELAKQIVEEKAEKEFSSSKATFGATFLPLELIEELAFEDRKKYLMMTGADRIRLPEDREKIARVLFDLRVSYTDCLFGPSGEMLYGGLFPEGCYYHLVDKVIVISTHRVKGEGLVSEETKNFQTLHEIGHYRLHLNEDISLFPTKLPPDRPVYCSSGARGKTLETQANLYASAFLLPLEEVTKIIGNRKIIDRREISKIFPVGSGVSRKTFELRLKSLGIQVIEV
jgi:transcriptional regulator with XRE-family HTH domain